jgi:energy-coupling factor transporter ATP-binding protein EcfA2
LINFRNSVASRLDNRPLLGTVERSLFVGPDIFPKLRAGARRGLNALVLGPPGAGKTTLLRALEADINADEELPRPVYVDMGSATSAAQALMLTAEALGERNVVQAWGDTLSGSLVPPSTSSALLIRLVRRLADTTPAVILADSPPGEGQAHVLFGRLRDELWQLPHQWVVGAHSGLRDELTRPPANAFFDLRLELGPLTEGQQRDLLERRLADEPRLVDIDALVGETDGLPRSVIALAREAVLSDESVGDVIARREEVRARRAALPRTAQTIAEYLATHGPTSGSDPKLLGTLGVSGQRARQVLRDLERAGVVRGFAEQQDRRGRPRKLYELIEGG